jgi:hypothetical protein
MFAQKDMDYYKSLTRGGECTVNLSQDEACIVLKVHDYSVEDLSEEERQVLYQLTFKLKDQIWP